MKQEVLKTKNSSFEQYEELLIKKDLLKEEAEQIQSEYSRTFGELKTILFKENMQCIKKKKTIHYCKNALALNKPIIRKELNAYVKKEMKQLNDILQKMTEENEKSKKHEKINKEALKEIKKIYFRIAKLIHPDMNPSLKYDDTIKDLWNRTLVAQKEKQLKEIQEVEFLVNKYLESINLNNNEIIIPDIDDKIKKLIEEIEEIENTEPYLYKTLLDDEKAIEIEKKHIQKEIDEYVEYGKQLDSIIERYTIID